MFNSYGFVLFFLPVVIALYYIGNRIKPVCGKVILILSSLLFYSYGRTDMLKYLGISMLVNYVFALLINKKLISNRLMLGFPVALNVGLLIYFKYTEFFVSTIGKMSGIEFKPYILVLPLGISFYTFQQIAYIVAVNKDEIRKVSLIDYCCYILYFPKIIMGPLMEPVDFMSQINDGTRKKIDIDNIAKGVKIFSLGLIKKALFADAYSRAVIWIYGNLNEATALDIVFLCLFYTFEIYFDFSGYSDMAVGVSTMLNIDLPINFDSPYKALSIRDFWKRWHISLTKFLTKYIYIPLGGSRKGKIFTYVNVMIVFLISGLWHGANWTFVLWGVLHGLLSCFDRWSEPFAVKVLKPVRWFLTFAAVNILWLLFSAESISQWGRMLERMVKTSGLNLLSAASLPDGMLGFMNMIMFIILTFIILLIPQNNYKTKDKLNAFYLVLASLSFIWGVLCLGNESTFVYFGF